MIEPLGAEPATGTWVQARESAATTPSRDRHFVALDGWRGICALLVALYHFMLASHFLNAPFVRGSYLFVDFFFILSGFVIAHAYGWRLRNIADARRFALKRIARIWPLHAATLLMMIGLEVVELLAVHKSDGGELGSTFAGPYALSGLLPNALLLQSIGPFESLSWNIPSWSISVEMITYAVFALLALTCRTRLAIAAGVVSLTAAILLATLSQTFMNVTGPLGLCRCLFGFLLGYLIYQAQARWPLRDSQRTAAFSLTAFTLAELSAVVSVIAFVSAAWDSTASFLATLLFGWVVYIFSFEAGLISRILRLRPFVVLGMISYSVYMVHYPIFIVLRKATFWLQAKFGLALTQDIPNWEGQGKPMIVLAFGNQWVMDLVTAGLLGVCIGVALLTYRFIEMPGRHLFDFRRRRRATSLAAATDGT